MTDAPKETVTRFSAWHLFGLASFAVVMPVFLTLAESPEFFLAHGFGRRHLIGFAVLLGWGFPAAVAVIGGAGNGIRAGAGRAVGWGLAGVLLTVAILSNLLRLPLLPAVVSVAIAFPLGAGLAYAYAGGRAIRGFCSLLTVVAVVLPVWFAWQLDAFSSRNVTQARKGSVETGVRPSVVWLLMDEFSLESLLDTSGAIDAERFPNFAALASESMWFRNGTTVADFTLEAVPAQLTGRYPPEGDGVPPLYVHHPENAFTILHAEGYRVFERDVGVRLCPPSINEVTSDGGVALGLLLSDVRVVAGHVLFGRILSGWLPPIDRQISHFGLNINYAGNALEDRGDTVGPILNMFNEFLGELAAGPNRFHYLHLMLPHEPYRYLSSGRTYVSREESADERSLIHAVTEGVAGMRAREPIRTEAEYPVWLARQRYLLQVQFADRLLGLLVTRLRELGMYDDIVFVVSADHGVSFRPGRSDRHITEAGARVTADDAQARDISKVPLFIKPPDFVEGQRIDSPARTIDVLPTLLDLVGIAPRDLDGASLLGPDALREDRYLIFSDAIRRLVEHTTTADAPGYLAELDSRNVREEGFRPRSPWDAELLGREVATLNVRESALGGVHVALRRTAEFREVELASGHVPALVTAEMFVDDDGEPPAAVAVSLNGRVEAIAVPYAQSAGSNWVRAMLPESSLVEGENRLELFGILETGEGTVLVPIAGGVAP